MMSSVKAEHVFLSRAIEIYENERMWIGRGFSKMGLLPTERGPYSTKDGSLSWKSTPEACLALLRGEFIVGAKNNGNKGNKKNGKKDAVVSNKRIRRGWSFHEGDDGQSNNIDDAENDKENLRREDEYECSDAENGDTADDNYCGFVPCIGPEDGPTDDKDGWQYFPDFSPQSLLSPNRKRGMLDFVRRRKLSRDAFFRPDHFLPQEVLTKCDYCDSNVVDMLSSAMLDALALATLFAYGPKKDVTDAQALPLKSKLIDTLSIGRNCSNESSQSEDDYDPWVDIHGIKDRLCTFAETCVGKPGPLMHLMNPDVNQNVISAMPGRRKVVERYLNGKERINLARLLIKDVDRFTYKMHCRNDSCACVMKAKNEKSDYAIDKDDDLPSCDFRLVPCPNENCKATFSYKHRTEHDNKCGYKLLPCPSGCGAMVPRNGVHVHVRDNCSLREAECPLKIIGCTATTQAKDVSTHLNDNADKHFILVANRMMEYQTVMKDLSARIHMLEEKNGQLERELKRTTAQLQSKSEAKGVSNDMKRLAKRLGTLESKCKTEFKQVEKDRRDYRK